MVQGILDRQAFGGSSRQEVVVSSDEGRGREVLGLECLARYESRSQLDSIMPAQAVALCEFDSTVDDRTINREQYKMSCTILQEATQDAVALLLGDAARRSRFCRQSRRHFGKGDFGEQDRVLRLGIGNLPCPRAARFVGVALHQGAGVNVVLGHGFAPRCS